MAVAKLNLLEIEFPQDKYEEVMMKIVNLDDFHPEPASKFVDSVHRLTMLHRDNPYRGLIEQIDALKDEYSFELKEVNDLDPTKLDPVKAQTLLDEMKERVKKINDVKKELNIVIEENETALTQLSYMRDSKINFDTIFSCKYLKVRFGHMQTKYVTQLDYYHSQEFFLQILNQDAKETYCLYITVPGKVKEIDNMFSALHFERINIPQYVHGSADKALAELNEETKTAKDSLATLDERIRNVYLEHADDVNRIYQASKILDEVNDASKYVVDFGELLSISGFCEVSDASKIKDDLSKIDGVIVDIEDAKSDSRLTPPTKIKTNWFSKPFSMFVEMYGVPGYTDFDPTSYVAITYCFLFGTMYGDVGQGLLLSLVGYLAYKLKGMRLGEVGMRLGLFSACFGIVFGSVFGSEEVLTPVFAPMDSSNTMTLLMAAIAYGVILILISMLINIVTNIKKNNPGTALFSQNGLAGFVFYLAVILMVAGMLGIDIPFVGSTPYIILFIALPVLLIFLKEPLSRKLEGDKMFPSGFGGFVAEGFFELFEIMLTFIANTMSFLRVGGFVLSHAGMMSVVYILAAMVGGMGYWIVLVIGNIFVMVLEGLIVGIQVLRLEYYEMFSRYYEGNGKRFVSIKER